MSLLKQILLMSLFSFLFNANAQHKSSIKVLEVSQFKQEIAKESVQLIDVRTPKEYEAGHINHAVNIDYFDQANFEKKINRFDKNKPVYLYCKSGNRSGKAAAILNGLGFQEIYDLKGGFMAWQNAE